MLKLFPIFMIFFAFFAVLPVHPELEEIKGHRLKRENSLSLVNWFKFIKSSPTKFEFRLDLQLKSAIKFTNDKDVQAVEVDKDANGDFHGWGQIRYKDGSYAHANFTNSEPC